MKANLKFVWLAALLVAGVALAVKQVKFSKVNDPNPQWFTAGYFVGTDKQNPVSSTLNKRGHHLCGQVTYDFPAVTANTLGAFTCLDIPIQPAANVVGCQFGDGLTVGVDQVMASNIVNLSPYQGEDGGAASLSARLCLIASDGGTFNMPDASYTLCCDGNN